MAWVKQAPHPMGHSKIFKILYILIFLYWFYRELIWLQYRCIFRFQTWCIRFKGYIFHSLLSNVLDIRFLRHMWHTQGLYRALFNYCRDLLRIQGFLQYKINRNYIYYSSQDRILRKLLCYRKWHSLHYILNKLNISLFFLYK